MEQSRPQSRPFTLFGSVRDVLARHYAGCWGVIWNAQGKNAVGAYWAKTFQLIPDLHFELICTLIGVNSITLYYKGARSLAAEVFHLGPDKKVVRAYAHYAS